MAKVDYKLAQDYTAFEMAWGVGSVRVDDSGTWLHGEAYQLDDSNLDDQQLIVELDHRHEVYRSDGDPKALPEALDPSTWGLPTGPLAPSATQVSAPPETQAVEEKTTKKASS
jgi:hypothetical protein